MQQPVPRRDVHRRGACGLGVVVDEHEEGDLLVAHERARVALVAGADRDELDALRLQVVVPVAQLHGVVAAVQAAEVPEEHEHDRPVGPEVAEPVLGAVLVGEREVREGVQVHSGSLPSTCDNARDVGK